jgi:RNA polymerase sigma factor (sigma-70 family)
MTPFEDTTDQMLIRAVAQGDERAFDQLYERHGVAILTYLLRQLDNRQLAEEILQDVLLAIWQAAPRFEGRSKVRTWMLSIARHHAINVRQRKLATREIPLHDQTPDHDTGPLEKIERGMKHAKVREALQQLEPDLREILELTFYYELSGLELAEMLGIPLGTLKSRLHRAKSALRDLLYSRGTIDV